MNLKPEHIEGLSFWFWVRENNSFIHYVARGEYRAWRRERILDLSLNELGYYIIGVPIGYTIGMIIGPWRRRNEARIWVKEGRGLVMMNKTNIEYFTVLDTLSRKNEDV